MIVAVDPSSTYTGIAVQDGDNVRLHRVRMLRDTARSYRERLLPLLPSPSDVSAVLVEEPPDTARKDTGRAGKQAVIGRAVSWVGGLIASPYVAAGVPVDQVQPGPWRESMLLAAARRGLLLEAPSRASRPAPPPARVARSIVRSTTRIPGGRFRLVFACGHEQEIAYNRLEDGAECAACRAPKPVISDADWITDEWKRIACVVAARFWPEAYAGLVREAEEGARSAREHHRLAGVADAAEAGCMLLHHVAARGLA